MRACQATVLFEHINEGFIRRGVAKGTHHRSSSKEALHIERTHDKAQCPSPADSHRSTSVRLLQLDCSSCTKSRNDFLRPPVRKPTLVWARTTVWAVMPAQVVTPLETMESFDSETQLLARNRVVMSFRLCKTAKLDLASAWNEQRSVSSNHCLISDM